MENTDQENDSNWHKDPNNWVYGIFYFNREDKRVFLPKKVESMGITINFANPKSILAVVIMLAFFSFIIFMIDKNN